MEGRYGIGSSVIQQERSMSNRSPAGPMYFSWRPPITGGTVIRSAYFTNDPRQMKRILLTSFIGILGLCAHALTVETIIIQHSYCGRPSGAAYANATGGTPPYTYSWDIPSTEANVHGLSPGIYTV